MNLHCDYVSYIMQLAATRVLFAHSTKILKYRNCNVCDGETGVMGKRVVHFEIFNYYDNYATIRLRIHGFIASDSLYIFLYLSISISESRTDISYLLNILYLLNLFFFFHFWLDFPLSTIISLIISMYYHYFLIISRII